MKAVLIFVSLLLLVSAVPAEPSLSTIRNLKLPEVDPMLPAGKGVEKVQVNCAVCHTPHYILNQPPLSKETWIAEVAKMQKSYGAPIPPENVEEIVEYLVSVRGTVRK